MSSVPIVHIMIHAPFKRAPSTYQAKRDIQVFEEVLSTLHYALDIDQGKGESSNWTSIE